MPEGNGNGWLGPIAAALGAISSVVTIYQFVKKCPCDGTPLPWKLRCESCGHDHWF